MPPTLNERILGWEDTIRRELSVFGRESSPLQKHVNAVRISGYMMKLKALVRDPSVVDSEHREEIIQLLFRAQQTIGPHQYEPPLSASERTPDPDYYGGWNILH